jgi:DNA-directed RNA polymerase specialized sigma24 family protein
LAFVPFAIGFGAVSEMAGVDRGALIIVAVAIAAGALMLVVLPTPRAVTEDEAAVEAPSLTGQPAFPPDRFLPPDDPNWPGHWKQLPTAWTDAGLPVDSPEVLERVRATVAGLPPPMRQLVVLRDIQDRSPEDVGAVTDLSPDDQLEMLQSARSVIRAQLEAVLESKGARQ